MNQKVVNVFYNDIVNNNKFSESIVEYALNKNIEGFNELLNNGIDRYVEFGRDLLITDINNFTKELAKKLNNKGYKANFLDIYFDRCGNIRNILVEIVEVIEVVEGEM